MLNIRSGLIGATLTSVLCLATANAADLGYGGGYKDVGYTPLWNGPYVGVHGGYASSSIDIKDVDGLGNTFSNNGSGSFGGGTIGWNWQFGHIVYSAEMDIGVIDTSHTKVDPISPVSSSHVDAGVYGDITGRVGYAMGPSLVYAKGGFGWFNGDGTVTTAGLSTFKTQSFYGWTLGAGVEYKVAQAWSVKAEYLHFDVGSDLVADPNGLRWKFSPTLDTVKVGLNYHIQDRYAPLK